VKYAGSLDADVLYITADSRSAQAYTCSEIYTLFGAGLDARYFEGKADAYSSSGRKLLPYAERYKYIDFSSFTLNQPVGAVYVINMSESYLFDQSFFSVANSAVSALRSRWPRPETNPATAATP